MYRWDLRKKSRQGFGDELRFETAKWKFQAAMMMFLMFKTKTCRGEVSGYGSFLHEHVNM